MKTARQTKIFALMLLLLFVIFILTPILPHTHECESKDCAICLMIESARNIGVLLASAFLILPILLFACACVYIAICKGLKLNTLVTLKVKLSD